MAIFNSYVKLPEGSWLMDGCSSPQYGEDLIIGFVPQAWK